MAEETTPNANNAGARTEEAKNSPEMVEEARNAAAGEGPNFAGGPAPSTAEEHVPSTSDPEATDLPTQDNPDPKTANPEVDPNAAAAKESGTATSEADEEKPAKPAAKKPKDKDTGAEPKAGKKPAKPAGEPAAKGGEKKPKKEAKPAVEDKPFPEFIQQDYLPALEKAFEKREIQDLKLKFEQNEVTGRWAEGQRQFTVYFPKEDIKATKAFSCASGGFPPSTIEPFLIDERKVDLDLLVFGVVQRLNAQKWFGKN